MSRIRKAKIEEIERGSGYRFLGDFDIELEVELTDKELIEVSNAQSRALEEIRKIERQLKDISDKMKGQIKGLNSDVYRAVRMITTGKKTKTETFPCFYCPKEGERLYMNVDTGEEIMRTKAEANDAQVSMDTYARAH